MAISTERIQSVDWVECENGKEGGSTGKSWEECDEGKMREGRKAGLYRQWGFQVRRRMSVITRSLHKDKSNPRRTNGAP